MLVKGSVEKQWRIKNERKIISDIDKDKKNMILKTFKINRCGVMDFWKNKRVTVKGGMGFLGSFVVEQLQQKNLGLKQRLILRKV